MDFMKKLLMLMLCLALLLSAAACGGQTQKTPEETPAPTEEPAEETPEPTPEPTPEEGEAAQEKETTAAGASDTDAREEAPASGSDAEYTEPTYLTDLEPTPEAEDEASMLDDAMYEAAMTCKGRSVEELYDLIGEPTGGSLYAASCEEENAEDGMLYYDGFYVWTVKNSSGETVRDIGLLNN